MPGVGLVVLERDDAVAVVTLNRPERRNALDEQTACLIDLVLGGLRATNP